MSYGKDTTTGLSNIDEIDYVNNEEDKKKVLSMIEEKLNEIRNR